MTITFFVLIGLVVLGYFVYEGKYYKNDNFQILKEDVSNYVLDCNELNEHISELKNKFALTNKIDYGNATFNDNSNWNFQRKQMNNISNSQFVYNCSQTVCSNAKAQPFKYLCKYFNISINENTLSYYEDMLNSYLAAEQGRQLLLKKRNTIMQNVYTKVPFLIKTFSKKKLEQKIGFIPVDIRPINYPTYTFNYISAGGNSSMQCNIILDIPNLTKFIEYLSTIVKFKKSAAGQRALMTPALREKIKQRDRYTCQNCGVSLSQEPHLLLEIDHIIPISKGGLTTEDNLKTLCWRCNRSKGTKINAI